MDMTTPKRRRGTESSATQRQIIGEVLDQLTAVASQLGTSSKEAQEMARAMAQGREEMMTMLDAAIGYSMPTTYSQAGMQYFGGGGGGRGGPQYAAPRAQGQPDDSAVALLLPLSRVQRTRSTAWWAQGPNLRAAVQQHAANMITDRFSVVRADLAACPD
jgi:hypothetical protein